MTDINPEALRAVALWSSLNLGLMFLLGLHTFRVRVKEKVIIGTGDSPRMERAIRAHGIQVLDKPLPTTRVIGNLLCWVIFGAAVVRLALLSL